LPPTKLFGKPPEASQGFFSLPLMGEDCLPDAGQNSRNRKKMGGKGMLCRRPSLGCPESGAVEPENSS
jgi:hypothetical protein